MKHYINYVSPFGVRLEDGTERPITNTEMWQIIRAAADERAQRIARDGCCCEEGPIDGGRCRQGRGMCPMFERAKALLMDLGFVEFLGR